MRVYIIFKLNFNQKIEFEFRPIIRVFSFTKLHNTVIDRKWWWSSGWRFRTLIPKSHSSLSLITKPETEKECPPQANFLKCTFKKGHLGMFSKNRHCFLDSHSNLYILSKQHYWLFYLNIYFYTLLHHSCDYLVDRCLHSCCRSHPLHSTHSCYKSSHHSWQLTIRTK